MLNIIIPFNPKYKDKRYFDVTINNETIITVKLYFFIWSLALMVNKDMSYKYWKGSINMNTSNKYLAPINSIGCL